jgi:hypothetical protein
MATEIETKIEDFIDAAPRGGDDGMLEGTEIKTSNNFDDNWSDTSSEVSLSFLACSSSWTCGVIGRGVRYRLPNLFLNLKSSKI